MEASEIGIQLATDAESIDRTSCALLWHESRARVKGLSVAIFAFVATSLISLIVPSLTKKLYGDEDRRQVVSIGYTATNLGPLA